ncbi:MAG: dicarboxylate/amino acid:cation symporter [Crocinitomicaceae bacterium]|nr:dicarboxylate/amino acid:cation symporter [Crocinitomicaceae bacterium]
MRKLALHWKILIAMLLGIVWSILSGAYGWNDFTSDWINPFGTIFINCLKFIAVPLVMFSIITGVAGLGDPSKLGRMGFKTLGMYLITTVFSVTVGLLIVNTLKPGVQTDEGTRLNHRLEYEVWATDNDIEIKDGRLEMANVSEEKINQIRQKLDLDKLDGDYIVLSAKNEAAKATKDGPPLQPMVDMVPSNLIQAMGNGKLMLQVIFFALFFGIAMILLPRDKTETVRSFFDGMNEVFIKMVNIVMLAAPFFVFCLMAGVLAKSADNIDELMSIFLDLGFYAVVVMLGLSTMLFLFYPLLLRLFGVRINYVDFFKGMSPAQFLAFSTSSSAATLPVTIECVTHNLKVPEEASDFVLPIGATVNMDGTSLYQAVAVIFLANYYDVDLSMMQQLGIVGLATLSSIGAAAVPSAGLIMLMIVLDSVGLNPMWVALVLPVDRILDMCRTVVNVTSDATVSAIIAKSEKMI